MKHFEYDKSLVSDVPRIKSETRGWLTEVMEEMKSLNFVKLEVSTPLGRVVFLPKNGEEYGKLLTEDLNEETESL